MNRDEIRALIGGYATGSLTEAEKIALFEAALDDQELFDELAREQALKAVIDQPGVRKRLIASLEPVRAAAWWRRPSPWAAAAVTAIVIATIFALRPAQRTEVARVEPTPVAPRIESVPPAPPASAPASLPKRAPRISKGAAREQKQTAVAQAGAAAEPPPASAPSPSPPPPAPAAAQPRAQSRAIGSLRALASGFLPKPFGFHYAIDWTGDVTVTANSDGYLRILANQGDVPVPLFPGADGPVRAGSTAAIALPPGTDAVLIQFYASPPPPNDTTPYTQTTDPSGAVSEPASSPDSKLRIRIAK